MKNTIIAAITNRNILQFTYHGHARTVEPHAIGVTRAGHDALRCFQTAGGSVSGEVPGWKLPLISEIQNLVVVPESNFASARPGYSRNDKHMTTIYAQL